MRWALALIGLFLLSAPAWAAPTSWRAEEGVVAGLLDKGAGPAQLSAAITKQDKTIDVSALNLSRRIWLVTLSRFEDSADVFMLAPQAAGYAVVWRLEDTEVGAAGDLKPLRAWAPAAARDDCRQHLPDADWADCGPIAPDIGLLPAAATGDDRFWLLGTYAQDAGETESAQLSLWRWDGRAATPLLVRTFQFKIEEDGAPTVAGAIVSVPVKGDFKTMLSCGACSGRQRLWRFRLTGDVAEDLGQQSRTPELDVADDLFDRAAHHRSLAGLASQSVAAAIAAHIAKIDIHSHWPMGTLEEWILSRDRGRLCLATDGGGTWLLTLTLTREHGALSAVRARYLGEGLCHDSVHWRDASSGS